MLDDLLSEEGAEGAVVFRFPQDVMGLPLCCIVVGGGYTDEGCCAAGGNVLQDVVAMGYRLPFLK